jgi:Cu-processing system permease protein
VVLSLLNATLLLVPLVALVFGTMHVYASREFIELLLAQPLPRRRCSPGSIWGSRSRSPVPSSPDVGAAADPQLWRRRAAGRAPVPRAGRRLPHGGLRRARDGHRAPHRRPTARDGHRARRVVPAHHRLRRAVLAVVSAFGDWPLERPLLALMLGNPVDVARVLVLTALDASALLGYTGAAVPKASSDGARADHRDHGALALVRVVPVLFARRRFLRRDF